jgi:hypothetical protein
MTGAEKQTARFQESIGTGWNSIVQRLRSNASRCFVGTEFLLRHSIDTDLEVSSDHPGKEIVRDDGGLDLGRRLLRLEKLLGRDGHRLNPTR